MRKFALPLVALVAVIALATTAQAVDVSRLLDQAASDYSAGNYQQAIAEFQQILKADPRDVMAHYYLAYLYYRNGQRDLAQEQFMQVALLDRHGPQGEDARDWLRDNGTPQALAQLKQLLASPGPVPGLAENVPAPAPLPEVQWNQTPESSPAPVQRPVRTVPVLPKPINHTAQTRIPLLPTPIRHRPSQVFQPSQPAVTPPEGDRLTLADEGISLIAPAGWQLEHEGLGSKLAFVKALSDGSKVDIDVSVGYFDPALDSASTTQRRLKVLIPGFRAFEHKAVRLSDMAGYFMYYQYPLKTGDLLVEQYVVHHGKRKVVLSLGVTEPHFKKYEDIFRRLAYTMEDLQAEAPAPTANELQAPTPIPTVPATPRPIPTRHPHLDLPDPFSP